MNFRFIVYLMLLGTHALAQTDWEDSLAVLEQSGLDQEAIIYLEDLTEVESDDQLLQLLILEEYYLKEDQAKSHSQDEPFQDEFIEDEGLDSSSWSSGSYLSASLTQGYHRASQDQAGANSIDTSTYFELQLGREHYFQAGEFFHILDYSLQLSRENYKDYQLQTGYSSGLDNQSKTTYVGLSLSYTLGTELWYNSLILDWLPIESQTDVGNSLEVSNFYLTEWVSIQPELGKGFSLPLSAYVSYAHESSMTYGANLSIQGEWGRHRVSLGTQSLMTNFLETSYEYYNYYLDSSSTGRTQFDNILQGGESQQNGTAAIAADQYHEFVDLFEEALISRAQSQESRAMDSYYYAYQLKYQYQLNAWSLHLEAELGQGGYFLPEQYYTPQGEDSLAQVSSYFIETEDGLYGQFEKDGLRYYALAESQQSTPHYQDLKFEAEVNHDLSTQVSWGVEFGYTLREYSTHPVFLGYSPRGSDSAAQLETAEFGLTLDWKF